MGYVVPLQRVLGLSSFMWTCQEHLQRDLPHDITASNHISKAELGHMTAGAHNNLAETIKATLINSRGKEVNPYFHVGMTGLYTTH